MASVSPPATERSQASSVELPTMGSIDPISSGDSLCPDSSLCDELTLQGQPGLGQASPVELPPVGSMVGISPCRPRRAPIRGCAS